MRYERRGPGFSLLEILIVMAIIGVIAAIAMPKAAEAIGQARESAALQHIKAIHAGQATYFSRHSRFARSLSELGPPPGAAILPAELANGEKLGYRFKLTAASASAQDDGDYSISAVPAVGTGSKWMKQRSFYSDASLVIRVAPAGSDEANAESPELGAARPGK